jgi:hypothetical protein
MLRPSAVLTSSARAARLSIATAAKRWMVQAAAPTA